MNDDAAPTAREGLHRTIHAPVLLDRVIELLGPAFDSLTPGQQRQDPPVLVDATLGLAGHTEALLTAFPDLQVVGLDRDPQALLLAKERLGHLAQRVEFVHSVYDQIADVLNRLGIKQVAAILFDLGVSSLQLDQVDRGFAYAQDAPLDMRMDSTSGITAEIVVNEYPPAQLVQIIAEYGEERFARRVVAAIVAARAKTRLTSSAHLAELVRTAIPAATRRTGGHPAKRTFQALRIEVNSELAVLRAALPLALASLQVGGRIAVLSYHSLEDRIVKHTLVAGARRQELLDLPVELPGQEPELQLLTRGAERPSEHEVMDNPRAASARLRAAERIREAA